MKKTPAALLTSASLSVLMAFSACKRQLEPSVAESKPSPTSEVKKAWRFDFGAPPDKASIPADLPAGNFVARYFATRKLSGLVQKDWAPIHIFSDYSPEKGFGWVEKDQKLEWFFERNDSLNPIFHQAETEPLYNMVADGLSSRKGAGAKAPFRVDAPPGTYKITIYFGDLSLGESRADMGALVNDQPVFQGINTTGGQVVGESRIVESTAPYLTVTFTTGKGAQPAVCGMTIEPVASGETAPAAVKIPATMPAGAMAKNLAHQIKRDTAEIDAVAAELASQGVPAPVPYTPGGTKMIATMYGDPSRMLTVDMDLDVTPQAQVLKRIGVDMVTARDPDVARSYKKSGLESIGTVHAEGFPPNSGNPVLQKLRDKAGTLFEEKGCYSLFAPTNLNAMTACWKKDSAKYVKDYSEIFVDEPRGMWAIGGKIGEYGPDALAAFNTWAAVNRPGFNPLTELPAPAMSQDFYNFFLFRLQAVPWFLSTVGQAAGFKNEMLLPGNGEIGPESVNHSTFFPPEVAKQRMSVGTWNYIDPWQVKRSSEVVAAAGREFGVPSAVYTSCGSDDAVNRAQALAALSARPSIIGPREGTSFRLFLELSAMMRAIGAAEHEAGVYLYWPASITYPDLVAFTTTEGKRWDDLARSLYDANLDFKATYRGGVPQPSLLVYAPKQAVLSDEEILDLRAYLEKGGTLVFGSESPLFKPDGTRRGTLEEVFGADNLKKIVQLKTVPTPAELRAIATERGVAVNPQGSSDQLKTFVFSRDGASLLMLLNTDAKQEATIKLPKNATDALTSKPIAADTIVTVQPGFFRLIQF